MHVFQVNILSVQLEARQLTQMLDANVYYFNWSAIEAGLCIITGSIPALRPLPAIILPKFYENYSMDGIVDSVKDTVNRVATRPGSRARSRSDSRQTHRRWSSDRTIRSIPCVPREHSFIELDSPETERARSMNTKMPKVSAAMGSVSSAVMQTVCKVLQVLRRRDNGDEERGRSRLSVINELEEVTSQRETGKHKVKNFAKPVDLSAAMADLQWWWARSKLNVWKSKRSAEDASSGVIIIMTEVEITTDKMEIHRHPRYPL